MVNESCFLSVRKPDCSTHFADSNDTVGSITVQCYYCAGRCCVPSWSNGHGSCTDSCITTIKLQQVDVNAVMKNSIGLEKRVTGFPSF